MAGEARELLRRPGEPQRTTFLELFFDLAFVVTLIQLSHVLASDLSWRGAFRTLVLLFAMGWIWYITVAITDRYNPHRPVIQVLVIATLVGTLVLVAAVPAAFGERGLVFAGAYVAIQIGRPLFTLFALRDRKLRRRPARALCWFSVSAVPWLVGAVTHGAARDVLWTLAVAVDYVAFALGRPTPGLGRSSSSEWRIVAEHLAERYRLFFIIALGELILVTSLTFSGNDMAVDKSAAFLTSIGITVLLWRIYIYRAGEVLATAIEASPDPLRLAISTLSAHMVMMAGIVVTAVGVELVIAHPLGHTPPDWTAVILGGPALFLVGRAQFEHAVLRRVSRDRPVGLLVLAVIAPGALLVPPLVVALAATAVLTGIAITDTVRTRQSASEKPSPPGGPL
ncbi:low temperature requirement protein A [Plantactinospora sp. CA-294935]|uniref:low temperature requirement protein A n=1 Tax=Plantactinospora sp. CA-294935 TaxID=3240012 RepID=UPI003D8FB173